MKLLALSLVIGCQICTFVPQAICQDNKTPPEQLHFSMGIPGTSGNRVVLTAYSMQRDLSSRASESVMHLSGKVEARMITCVPGRPGGGHLCGTSMVLRANEVDYNEKTGEIAARGDVRITPPK